MLFKVVVIMPISIELALRDEPHLYLHRKQVSEGAVAPKDFWFNWF